MGEPQLRAVLCDDDATVRQVVAGIVEDCGFAVVGHAALALEALVLAEMTKAHVLVLDLSLKGMSGNDLIPAVRSAAPGTEIVVYTAFDTLARLAEEEGVADVVLKAEPAKLEEALRRVAAKHGHYVMHP
jgi:two-component system, NarL family, response regulator NreC